MVAQHQVAQSRSSFRATTPSFKLTEKQVEVNHLLAGPQRHTLLVGGGRSGKTFLVCRAILMRALRGPGSRHLITRLHFNHVRASIWLDTLPKVARLCFPGLVLDDRRQDSYVSIPRTGSEIWFGGLDEKERVDKILGQEYVSIFINEVSQVSYNSVLVARTRLAQQVPLAGGGYLPIRAYYDLNPVGRRHWSHLEFFDKRSPATQNLLTHPEQFAAAYLNPVDNAENLPPETLQEYEMLPERQRMRFFLGQYSSEIEGALWTFESLDHARCLPSEVPITMRRVVVAVDPSGTAGDEETRSDDVGIIVAGLGDDGNAYVLADRTCNLPPEAWARVAMTAYHDYSADHVVGEANYGGDMVRALIHSVDRNVKYYPVVASRGKAVRAEPVSAFYGHEVNGEWIADRVRHVGEFRKLEAELLDFSAAGYLGVRSPNRADALVWALTDLLVDPVQPNLWSQNDLVVA